MTGRRFAIISSQAFSLTNFRGPLIRDLIAAGWTVYAIAPDHAAESRARLLAIGAEPVDCSLSRTGLNPLVDIRDALRLALLLRRLRVDAMLGYCAKPVIFGTIAGWLARVPQRYALIAGLGYVFVLEGAERSARRWLLRWSVGRLYRFALGRARRVFFQNEDDLGEFVRMKLVDGARARNTYGTGIDLAEWSPAPPVTAPVTFLLAARLLREKGIPEFAEAARQIKHRFPDVRFILLGGLDLNPGGLSRSEVEGWLADGLLEWHGHVSIAPWLEQASVYVLPSYYREGVPRSIQEAMAMGRPVITTDAVGCRETVIDGRNGFLVPTRDVAALVAAMLRFVVAPELIEPMGLASRKLVAERFDVKRVNRFMIDEMELAPTVQVKAHLEAQP